MALKPTIYKFKIGLSDLNQNYFDTLNLTVAQHPSETAERMIARVMAFCLHAANDTDKLMAFTKGLSAADEADICLRGLNDVLYLSIDVGEPSFERAKKASRLCKETYIYSFNSKSDVWWKQSQAQFSDLAVHVMQLDWAAIQAISKALTRTFEFSVTLSEQSAYVALPDEQVELNWQVLQA